MMINPKIKDLYDSMNMQQLSDQLEELYSYRGGYRLGYITLTQNESNALDNQINYIRRLVKSWFLYLDI